MAYRIYAIGPKHDPGLQASIVTYEKRLSRVGGVDWVLLPYSPLKNENARHAESSAIRAKIKTDDYVILLDGRGIELSSEGLAAHLDTARTNSKHIVFVIGGAYGVDEELRSRADLVWSLSRLVFPHQIVRLILVEQLYRAHTVLDNHPYHH